MINIIYTFHAFSAGAFLLLGTLIFLGVNHSFSRADRWLGTWYYLMACLFTQLFLEGFHIESEGLIHTLELPRWATLPASTWPFTTWSSQQQKFGIGDYILFPSSLSLFFSIIYLIPGLFNNHIHPPQLPQWIFFAIKYFFLHNVFFIGLAVIASSKYTRKTFASYLPIRKK